MSAPQILGTYTPPSGPRAQGAALDWLDALGRRQGWGPQLAFRARLCVDEALSNVLTHGVHPGGSAPSIVLRIGVCEGRLVIELSDDGPAFDPTTQFIRPRARSIEAAAVGGHGLRLMRHYLNALQYQRVDGLNRLRMVLEPDPGGTSP